MIENGENVAEARTFGWGVIGTGEIAGRFAADLALVPGARLAANHSRTRANAESFRDTFGTGNAYTDLDAFMADPAIDAVYIATPNSLHLAQALKAIRSGKPVLVEKPLAPSPTEASVVQRESVRANIFAMEGLWTRFLPAVKAAKAKVERGEIGTIRRITGELAYAHDYRPDSRFFNRILGGGASLDLGIYCVSLAMYFLGEPHKVSGFWHAAPNGVDMRSEITLHYQNAQAQLSCGFDKNGSNHFVIEGTDGSLRLDAPFIKARGLTIYQGFALTPAFGPVPVTPGLIGKVLDRLPIPGRTHEDYPFEGNGLQFEAMAVMDAIGKGQTAAEEMPLSGTISALRAISMVLKQPASQKVIRI